MNRFRAIYAVFLLGSLSSVIAQTNSQPATPGSSLEDVFRMGVIVQDTNGDKIADAICGHVIVPKAPGVAENTSAANLAARLGYETSALTLPVVVSAATPAGQTLRGPGHRYLGGP